MKKLYIFEYEDTLFAYSAFVVAHTKKEADKLVDAGGGSVFVEKHEIKSGMLMEGGGNG